jgi:hypothetical protein
LPVLSQIALQYHATYREKEKTVRNQQTENLRARNRQQQQATYDIKANILRLQVPKDDAVWRKKDKILLFVDTFCKKLNIASHR